MQTQTQTIIGSLYELGQCIGAGGGGEVFLATHTRLQKTVVIKRVKTEVRGKIDERGEANILKNLKHTYLPQVYDFFYENGEIYTVFDFIAGSDFKKLLDSGNKYKQQDVVKWGTQLAQALVYLHAQKPPIIHGDIKPANIMLAENGDVCLIDFNISMVMEGASAAIMGLSAGYSSPEHYRPLEFAAPVTIPKKPDPDATEILRENDTEATEILQDDDPDKTEVLREDDPNATEVIPPETPLITSSSTKKGFAADERSDIYSLGASLYHMLTGVKPAIATGNVKPLSAFNIELGESIVYIVEKCMASDPTKRFQSAEQVVKAFTDIHKLDSRWRRQSIRQIITTVTLTAILAGSALSGVYGYNLIGEEKVMRYNELVIAINQDIAAFDEAVELFPEKIEAYHAYALALYNRGEYEECIKAINEAMARFSAFTYEESDIKLIGDIYFIGGNCYFESEDYVNAAVYYEAAISNNCESPSLYLHYAISLARSNRADNAAELLDKIDRTDISALNLLRGEIEFARSNYEEAIEFFQTAINNTNDSDFKYRAYIISDTAFQRLSHLSNEHIALLREAIRELPDRLALKERLGDVLYKTGKTQNNADYYREAAELFEDLRTSGYITFNMSQNIGLLYMEAGDLQAAHDVFTEMLAIYPDDYRVPKQLTFLALQEQGNIANESRNYSQAVEWYNATLQLYNSRPPNAADDPEMLMLAGIIEDLRSGGWI